MKTQEPFKNSFEFCETIFNLVRADKNTSFNHKLVQIEEIEYHMGSIVNILRYKSTPINEYEFFVNIRMLTK